jgi:hypothetical protein
VADQIADTGRKSLFLISKAKQTKPIVLMVLLRNVQPLRKAKKIVLPLLLKFKPPPPLLVVARRAQER